MKRTRFAPTPSGYLHAGNAWSFVLTWLLARRRGGRILLRIDDMDSGRYREDFLEDIFASLAWLGLDFDEGPRNAAELRDGYSQRRRRPLYHQALDRLRAVRAQGRPAVYACPCSRLHLRELGGSCDCAERGIPLDTQGAAWRLFCPPGEKVKAAAAAGPDLELEPAALIGDFTVRQKDGSPAYQLCSVVDDAHLEVDTVVRGRDLLPSTAAQLLLARRLDMHDFVRARFLHHALLVDERGVKLAKSRASTALRNLRREGTSEALYHLFGRLLGRPGARGPEALVEAFAPERLPGTDIPWPGLTGVERAH